MPRLTGEQLSHARELFLASADGEGARKRIESLTQKEADFMETSLEELKAARTFDEITAFAHEKHIELAELLFSLASKDLEEFTGLFKARDEEIKSALGL